MEAKPKALVESKKKATKAHEDEKKTRKDDVMTTNGHQDKITLVKGNIKFFEGLRQSKTTKDDQSPNTSRSSSSSSSYVMKMKMGNYKKSIQRSENTNKKMENHDKNKKLMVMKQNIEESSNVHKMKNKKVWDCDSTLYDSFELNSFNRQLDSAISSSARSMSMPHLSSPPSSIPSPTIKKQSPNKISRSLQKLIKSMFRHKQSNATFKASKDVDMDKYYVVFDKTGSLTTIPESGESTDVSGSETNSLVRKTVSERFPRSRLVGLSCSYVDDVIY